MHGAVNVFFLDVDLNGCPNRPYWIGMTKEDMSFEQAIQVTYNLLVLCLLQFGSLIFLMIPLQFKCRMPIFKQLSFIFQSD